MIPVPNLDDRRFADLVREAREKIAVTCPEWTDLSVHDPGMVMVEAFAHLTEVMLYRFNRLPERAYVEFLNLLGVVRHPPSAAWTELTFTRVPGSDATQPITIPAGTRIAAARGADPTPVVFVVTTSVLLPAGQNEVKTPAYHCDPVEGELLGVGNGAPGQILRAAHTPIVTTAEAFDVMLGVETHVDDLAAGATAREHEGRTYEIWRPVETFAGAAATDRVYRLDRESGTVTFAPALDLRLGDGQEGARPVAALPTAGRQIRLWYRTGGGPSGNVAAGQLTTLRDPVQGVTVTNAAPARGGRAIEGLEQAMVRGPYEFYSQLRAVTARDFELLATSGSAAVSRARAFTRASMWSFARPGEVEVVLVPHVGEEARPGWRLPAATVTDHQMPPALAATQASLDARRALGTTVVTTWARYKSVSVRGRVVVRAQENADAVRQRIHDRLYQVISPLPTPASPDGWAFGEPMRASNVYRLLEQSEPGVRYVDDVRFVVDEAPDARVRSVEIDNFQPATWYAGCESTLFRSTNAGQGWEAVGHFPNEIIRRASPAPAAARPGITPRPGNIVVVTRTEEDGSCVYLSTSLGESWTKLAEMEPAVNDIDWIDRADAASLLMATDSGLYELSLLPGSVPLQILVDPQHADRGFYSVRAFVSERGVPGVALAAQAQYGVYLSTNGGTQGSFNNIGMAKVDTRTLAVQYDGPATLLWVGAGEPDVRKPGQGVFRARLFEAGIKWDQLNDGWTGGTCWDLAFSANAAYAATQSGGMLRLTLAPGAAWEGADVNSGLPLRDRTRFASIETVAVDPSGSPVLVGGASGVTRSTDALRWNPAAGRETTEVVTIPDTWLLCSGEHDIEVVSESA
ncbi:MAG TPA: baseplate J/gp47 family protein [Micromonosporaceae bacterium]|nr:baseplate J/gp47 family protein [Micromonosporaceae bacterium]